jgi:hypothetical protein
MDQYISSYFSTGKDDRARVGVAKRESKEKTWETGGNADSPHWYILCNMEAGRMTHTKNACIEVQQLSGLMLLRSQRSPGKIRSNPDWREHMAKMLLSSWLVYNICVKMQDGKSEQM